MKTRLPSPNQPHLSPPAELQHGSPNRAESGGDGARALLSPLLTYPLTLWTCVCHPTRMSNLAERELRRADSAPRSRRPADLPRSHAVRLPTRRPRPRHDDMGLEERRRAGIRPVPPSSRAVRPVAIRIGGAARPLDRAVVDVRDAAPRHERSMLRGGAVGLGVRFRDDRTASGNLRCQRRLRHPARRGGRLVACRGGALVRVRPGSRPGKRFGPRAIDPACWNHADRRDRDGHGDSRRVVLRHPTVRP